VDSKESDDNDYGENPYRDGATYDICSTCGTGIVKNGVCNNAKCETNKEKS
jgi:hypothetical protein